jgi:RNA polymerase sigma factor (TIGR02999 family)
VTKNEDITLLLSRIDAQEPGAMDELMRVVYRDLERIAASHLQRQFGERVKQLTLEPAALVNESFLRLIKQRKKFDNRGQFFAVATKIMLRVLCDYRREKLAAKRGGGAGARMTLSLHAGEVDASQGEGLIDVELLTSALDNLDHLDSRKADIVKMRVVWGMTVPEVAEALDISPSAVDRDWRFAKAWIADEAGLTQR